MDSRLQNSFQVSVTVAHFFFVYNPVSLLFVFIQAVKHYGERRKPGQMWSPTFMTDQELLPSQVNIVSLGKWLVLW